MPKDFLIYKVTSPPVTPEPDAIYLLNSAPGFDMFVTNGSGAITLKSLNAPSHSHTSVDISNFDEAAQDAIGSIVNSTLSYNDSGPSLGVVSNTSTQKVEISKAGTLSGTRKRINLIEGAGVSITVADNSGSDRVDITLATTGVGITDGDKGDIVVTGSGLNWAIDANAVSNTKLSTMPANTLKGNNSGIVADPSDLTVSQVKSMLNYTAGDVGAQPLDATLTAIAGVSVSADTLLYATGADAFTTTSLTSFARSILDDNSGPDVRTTLGIATTDAVQFTGFDNQGYLNLPIRTVNSNTNILDTDHSLMCDASGGAFQVTLPTAIGRTGRVYRIKKVDTGANAVTLATTSSQTVDGAITRAISISYEAVAVQSNGANWYIL